MSMLFLGKNVLKRLVSCICTFFVAASLFYSINLSTRTRVSITTTFYFLVKSEMHVAASVELIQMQGGAGYLLNKGNDEYVVLSVHLTEDDATVTALTVSNLGQNVALLVEQVNALYFRFNDRNHTEFYCNALNVFKGNMYVLENIINLLDEGEVQTQIKYLLSTILKRLNFLAECYKSTYKEFSNTCNSIAKMLNNNIQGVVFAKDLRYILCAMADGYLKLCKAFAI